jgi:hypothetical protein
MGTTTKHPEVKLIVGFIAADARLFDTAAGILKRSFGPVDFESPVLAFELTDYYEEEFGRQLKRKFISFKKLIPPDALAKIKITTNRIERKLSAGKKRAINIDPGYLDLAKLVLASTKNFYHRIYIGKDIFAEITLFYQNKDYRTWEWTYPDYRSAAYIEIFKKIRNIYRSQLK